MAEEIKAVYIDYRENKRIRTANEVYERYNPKVANLTYGDYLFIGDNDTEVLFEYKTSDDFLTSIRNNHLYNQTLEATVHYNYQFVIVECYSLHDSMNKFYYNTGIDLSREHINGAIASLNKFSTVLFAQSRESAFDLMERQAIKILEDKPLTWKFSKKTLNPALNYLTSIKGLSKQAHIICKKLNLNSLNDLMNLTEKDLTTVDGIGRKKAKVILKAINGE